MAATVVIYEGHLKYLQKHPCRDYPTFKDFSSYWEIVVTQKDYYITIPRYANSIHSPTVPAYVWRCFSVLIKEKPKKRAIQYLKQYE